MKKILKNKKGVEISTTFLVVALLALLALGVGIAVHVRAGGTLNIFDRILGGTTQDFDGDGIPDVNDPCPCGFPPNQKNLRENIEGIQRCILSFSECDEEKKEFGFVTKESARGGTVCTYLKPDCMKYIEHVTSD